MRILQFGALILLALTACQIGTSAQGYPPAKGPAGVMLNIQLADKSKLTGELLAVEDSSLLILQGPEILRVRLNSVRAGSGPKVSFTGKNLAGDLRERLRLVSRFPQGVSAELEPRLIQAYGQTAIRSVP
jgi:hypothetical protein